MVNMCSISTLLILPSKPVFQYMFSQINFVFILKGRVVFYFQLFSQQNFYFINFQIIFSIFDKYQRRGF